MLPSDLQSGLGLTEDGSPLLHVVSGWANSVWGLELPPGSDIHTSPAVVAGFQVRLQSELPPGFSQAASPMTGASSQRGSWISRRRTWRKKAKWKTRFV